MRRIRRASVSQCRNDSKGLKGSEDTEKQREHDDRAHHRQDNMPRNLPPVRPIDLRRLNDVSWNSLASCNEERHVKAEIFPYNHKKQSRHCPSPFGKYLGWFVSEPMVNDGNHSVIAVVQVAPDQSSDHFAQNVGQK